MDSSKQTTAFRGAVIVLAIIFIVVFKQWADNGHYTSYGTVVTDTRTGELTNRGFSR